MLEHTENVATQAVEVLQAMEKGIEKMMAQSEREDSVVAEHTSAIIAACSEAASFKSWSSAVRESLTGQYQQPCPLSHCRHTRPEYSTAANCLRVHL